MGCKLASRERISALTAKHLKDFIVHRRRLRGDAKLQGQEAENLNAEIGSASNARNTVVQTPPHFGMHPCPRSAAEAPHRGTPDVAPRSVIACAESTGCDCPRLPRGESPASLGVGVDQSSHHEAW